MRILSVLNARASAVSEKERDQPSDEQEVWPSRVTAITFVITVPDDTRDRFVAYAIDADREGTGLYRVEGHLHDVGVLLIELAEAINRRSGTTLPVGGNPPTPGPKGRIAFRHHEGPNRDASGAVIGIATIHQEVMTRLQFFLG